MKFKVTRPDGTDNSGKTYLVVNTDEPYAGKVADLIENEERRKGTWEHGEKTMREVMGIPEAEPKDLLISEDGVNVTKSCKFHEYCKANNIDLGGRCPEVMDLSGNIILRSENESGFFIIGYYVTDTLIEIYDSDLKLALELLSNAEKMKPPV